MKNTLKKLLSLGLGLALVLMATGPLVAKANDGKITINNATVNADYTLYRVFDLSYDEANKAYTYTAVTEDLESKIKAQGSGYETIDSGSTDKDGRMIIDTSKFYHETNSPSGTIFAADFAAWLSDKTDDLTLVNSTKANSGTIDFSNLPLGYYLVKSSQGSLVALDTTDKEVEMFEKNIVPDLSKQVKLSNDTDYPSLADGEVSTVYANIGEVLNYQIDFNITAHADQEMTLTDELDDGIDYVDGIKVEVLNDQGDYEDLDTNLYTKTDFDNAGGRTLTITISRENVQKLRDSKIRVSYNAKLNNNAKMSNNVLVGGETSGLRDNTNQLSLKYDAGTDVDPVTAKAIVRTTDFNILKYTGEGADEKKLKDASFQIFTEETGGSALKFTKDSQAETYYFNSEGGVSTIKTTETGEFKLAGLKPGVYFIEETEAPAGFNPLQKRVKLEIKEEEVNSQKSISYKVDSANDTLTDNIVKIKNESGTRLPSTGGMGRTLIYVMGAILFLVSLVLLIARRRAKNLQ